VAGSFLSKGAVMEKKFIGYVIGVIIVVYLIILFLPYIELGLSLVGAACLWQEYEKNKNRRH
jgi:hypothetical protein